MQVPYIVYGLFEPCGDGEAAAVRHGAVKEVEVGYLVLEPRFKVAVAHGELVKIAEHGIVEAAVFLHCALLRSCLYTSDYMPDAASFQSPGYKL